MRKIKLFLLLYSALNFGAQTFAAEIIGGSLRYESLGNQKYKVIGSINRNCRDSALATPIFKIYAGTSSYILTATRTSITDITSRCKSATLPCNPANTITSDGQEQHIFEAIIDFSTSPYNIFYNAGKCEVMFSMEACCRSPKTTNITPNNFYLEAMLNLCILGNTLNNTNTGLIPHSYADVCANLPFAYNYIFTDKDNDSVWHTIEIPKKSRDSFERFIGQFSVKYPMSPYCPPSGTINCTPLPNAKPPRGFFFDNHTGDIILTPTVISENGIINIRSTEYRSISNTIVAIGYSTSELYIRVQACPDNNPPTIPTANKYNVCEGDKLCFTILSKDDRALSQTTADTTTMYWNFGIPGATFRIIDPTAREKSAEFCWQTNAGDARPNAYQFTAYAKDDHCPNPATTAKGFLVTVRPRAAATRKFEQPVCGKLIFDAVPENNPNFTGTYNYEWTIKDSSNSGTTLYKTFKKRDSFTFNTTGKYIITHIINNLPVNCPAIYMDTVQIKCVGGGVNIRNVYNQDQLEVYPNPASGMITIEHNNNQHYTVMHLYNSIGQKVYSGPATPTFDMSQFVSGLYIVEILTKEDRQVVVVVKE